MKTKTHFPSFRPRLNLSKSLATCFVLIPFWLCLPALGQFQQNLSFNGIDNVVDCDDQSNVFEDASYFTVEARVKFSTFSQWSTVFCKRTSDENRSVVLQVYSSTGQLGVAVSNGYGYTEATFSPNVWHHIAVIYNGTQSEDSLRLRLIVDGMEQSLTFLGTVPNLTPSGPTSRFCLGAEYNGGTPVSNSSTLAVPFKGSIDEVRIWKNSRSIESIIEDMDSELTLPQNNLRAYYRFNDGEGCGDNLLETTVEDEAGSSPATLWNFTLTGSLSNFTTEVDTSITVSGTTLTANASPAEYQWVNCETMENIPGQTSNTFTPTSTGNYSVIVTQDSCVASSACYSVNLISILPQHIKSNVSLYPNPAQNEVNLNWTGGEGSFEIMDLLGKTVVQRQSVQKTNPIKTDGMANGLYQIKVENKDGYTVERLQILK